MPLTGPTRSPEETQVAPQVTLCREKLVDSGYITLLFFSCRARRLAWSWKDSLGCDWLCSSSERSGVAVGSQVTNDRSATPKFTAPWGKPGNPCRAFSFGTGETTPPAHPERKKGLRLSP